MRALTGGRLRWTPVQIHLATGLTTTRSQRTTFTVPVPAAFDSSPPVIATTEALRHTARLEARPLQTLLVGADLSSERDLRDYGDTTTMGAVATALRRSWLGADVGFERTRTLNTRLAYTPAIASWMRPRIAVTSTFALSRDPNAAQPERERGDSAGAFRLPTAFTRFRATDASLALDVPRVLRLVLGEGSRLRRALDRVTQLDAGRRVERRAQFDRPGFDPDLAMQLGFGGRDEFRTSRGRAARLASEVTQDRLAMAMRLPLNLQLTSAYAERATLTWAARGSLLQEQRLLETDWPNVTARWLYSPRAGWVRAVLTSLQASAGVRVRETESLLPSPGGGAPLRATAQARSAPLSATVTWAPRLTTSAGYSLERSRGERAGTLTRNDREQTSADATLSFRFPQEFVPLRSDVRATARYLDAVSTGCIVRAGTEQCVPISDSRRREYTLIMDTDMPPNLTAGLSIGYVRTEDRHINRKFSQLVITASLRIAVSAGQVR